MTNKFAPKLTPELKQKIIEMHSEGYSNAEIGRTIDVANTTVRTYILSQGLSSNTNVKIRPQTIKDIIVLHSQGFSNVRIGEKLSLSNTAVAKILKSNGLQSNDNSLDRMRVCVECDKTYLPIYGTLGYDIYRFCCKSCSETNITRNRQKYTEEQINKVIELKKQAVTAKDIEEQTGVKISKIKDIVKDNDLMLTPEQRQSNAYKAKINKNPHAMRDLRSRHMSLGIEEYENTLLAIKKISQRKKLSVGGLAKKFNLNASSVVESFRRRGWGDIVDQAQYKTMQYDLYEIIASMVSVQVKYDDRTTIKPFELDIFIPELSLAVEFCGLYWHSEDKLLSSFISNEKSALIRRKTEAAIIEQQIKEKMGEFYQKSKLKHWEKYQKCKELGIELITIFEDEWVYNKEKVIDYLKSKMDSKITNIHGRKTVVKLIKNEEGVEFVNKCHLQGSGNNKVYFGLFYKNELIGCMAGGDHHRGTEDYLILSRLCFKSGIKVMGGTSKLFKSLKEFAKIGGYKGIKTWSDNRWGSGKVYERIGFTLLKDDKPDYSYVTDCAKSIRQSKQSNTKEKLLKKGAIGATESEMARSLGYSRIWDCGKKTWILDF